MPRGFPDWQRDVAASWIEQWKQIPDSATSSVLTYAVPSNKRYQVRSFFVTVATNATAGNRIATISAFDDAVIKVATMSSTVAHGPSITRDYSFIRGLGTPMVPGAGGHYAFPLFDLILLGSWRLEFSLEAAAGGDNLTNPYMIFEEHDES